MSGEIAHAAYLKMPMMTFEAVSYTHLFRNKGGIKMIINRIGAEFEYEGTTYVVGAPIVGTSGSEYEGLYGTITEIRDGEDKETENETPDI